MTTKVFIVEFSFDDRTRWLNEQTQEIDMLKHLARLDLYEVPVVPFVSEEIIYLLPRSGPSGHPTP